MSQDEVQLLGVVDINQLEAEALAAAGHGPDPHTLLLLLEDLIGRRLLMQGVRTCNHKQAEQTKAACLGAVLEIHTIPIGGC